MLIRRPSRWRSKPSGVWTINPASRQAVGLDAFVPLGGAAVDLVRRQALTVVGTNPVIVDPVVGPVTDLTAASDFASPATNYITGPTLPARDVLTVAGWVYVDNDSGSGGSGTRGFAVQDNATTRGHYFGFVNSGVDGLTRRLWFANNGGASPFTSGSANCTGGTTLSVQQWYHVAAVRRGTTADVYLNGRRDTAGTASGWASANAQTSAWAIGRRPYAGFEDQLDGRLAHWCWWQRPLSDAEIYELWHPDTRWDLYAPPTRRRAFFDVGTAYTLDAETGTITLTGTAADLLVGRALAADAGAVTLTGTDAALTVGRALSADAGTVTLTGTAADLLVGRALTADAGSLTVTGTDATLTVGRALVAEAGTVTLTGTDATLTVARTLTADAGTVTITGTDATLTYSGSGYRVLDADPGTVTLTGTDASLTVGRVLTAEAGAYSLTGTDVGLAVGRVLVAEAGTVTLTGTDVTFGRTYQLAAESGSFVLTGTDVTFDYSGAAHYLPARRTARVPARPYARVPRRPEGRPR